MFEKIKDKLHDYVEFKDEDITLDTNLSKDLKLTSFDFVTILGDLEDEFGIELDLEEAREVYTVGDFVKLLREKV